MLGRATPSPSFYQNHHLHFSSFSVSLFRTAMAAAKGDGGDRRPFSLLFLHFTKTHLFLSLPRVPILLYFERAHRRLSGSERRKMRRMTVGEAKFWLFLYLLSFISLPWGSLIFSLCFLSNPLVSPSFSGEPSGVPATARSGEARKFWFEPRIDCDVGLCGIKEERLRNRVELLKGDK